MSDTERLRELDKGGTARPWVARQGHGPDGFAPNGYKYVQFGPTEKKAAGRGTDQLSPADADLITAAVNALPGMLDRLDALEAAGRFMIGLIDSVYGTNNEGMKLPEEGPFRVHRAIIEGVASAEPHEGHHGNHDGYACGFSGPHCWTCNEPWPCRPSRLQGERQWGDAR